MKTESIFLDHVGDSPQMRILQHLIEGRDWDYTFTDLLNANVSWGTLHRIMPKLVALGLVVKTRKIGRATLYQINKDNDAARRLLELYDALILQALRAKAEELEMAAIA